MAGARPACSLRAGVACSAGAAHGHIARGMARRGTRCPWRSPARHAVPAAQCARCLVQSRPGAARGLRGQPGVPCARGEPRGRARPSSQRLARALRGSSMHDRRPCMVVCGPRASLACPCVARCPGVLRAAPVQLPCVSFVESHQCPRLTTACFYPSSTARRSSLSSPVSARSALKSRVPFARTMCVVRTCRCSTCTAPSLMGRVPCRMAIKCFT
jgi:hypothetical protein